ncbi:sigma-70 family RNA polymerase sigma factor [Clostridium paridis]|uniref:Sigma-70 family RNA polymerase sigma factor n=1 Tax=Clostridium paridis TaxID=2803863 RepID=A0A937FIN3_9CLOT|nr:sigma-70 family RNA polymerase sigma factor [Clostridium paridis]MBL4933047.1 sigma-70 family RNA polymerase sigma factor [Clostridium paridis]
MNFVKVENLALLSKNGDMKAKEELAEEFKPFILNLSKKSFIHGFDFEDIKNECYNSLFNCLRHYTPDKHRFVAYATISIKNSVGLLIRSTNKRNNMDGAASLILNDNLENILSYDMEFVEDKIIKRITNSKLKKAINTLSCDEKELVDYVFFKKHTLMQFSIYKNLSYSKVVNMKNNILRKLKRILNTEISLTSFPN